MAEPRDRPRLLAAGLLVAAAGLAAVAIHSRTLVIDPTVSERAGKTNLAVLLGFWIASAIGWAGLTMVWRALARAREGFGRPLAVAAVLGVALAARVTVLAWHTPALSDDVYRYVFDGGNFASGANPYLVQPLETKRSGRDAWAGQREVAGRVNNPELHTIYLPTSQLFFAATAKVLPDMSVDATVRAFRAALVLAEMIAVCLLLWVLARNGRSVWWATLYAWHPLALTEVAGSGHQEPIGIALLMLAMAMWTSMPRRVAQWTIALAAAALVKPVVVPIAPLLLRGRSWHGWAVSLLVGIVTCVLIAVPLIEPAAVTHLLETSSRFSLKWAHFGGVYEPVLWTIERITPAWTNDPQERLARLVCAGALGVAVLVTLLRAKTPWSGAAAIFLAMVVFSPSAHPWYLLWALIFMPMAPGLTLWTASLTISWGYVAWAYMNTQEGGVGWGVAPWVMVVAWTPVYLAAIASLFRKKAP